MGLREQLVVREARPEDAEDLKQFWLKLAEDMYEIEGYVIPSAANAEAWLPFLLKEIAEASAMVLVAQQGEDLVGFIYCSLPTREKLEASQKLAVVHDMYMKPNYRGKGIGAKLMKEGMRKIKEKGVKQVRLSVLSGNLSAVKFYEKHGFKVYRYGMRKEMR